ncbi:hypothetical protein FXB38_23930 [Bradyrhizobium cytisi]|uniref:Uncharacterized protein n=1 Tax=Bradyrhizobium cytisi TaxID=515489 RepID=A0A5S4WH75_9BRAD|nr:hypothetical protein FXB38_23930 [Bradyrhizobium cytisi]
MRVALLLVGLGTLAAMELEAPPRMTEPVNEPPAQATTGLRPSHDTLTKADRLEIPQFRAPPQPLSSSQLMHPPDHTAIVAQAPSKIIEQQKGNASGNSAIMLPRPRPRHGTSKANAGASGPKPVAEAKPCRSGAFESLFKVLNLQTRCQT